MSLQLASRVLVTFSGDTSRDSQEGRTRSHLPGITQEQSAHVT